MGFLLLPSQIEFIVNKTLVRRGAGKSYHNCCDQRFRSWSVSHCGQLRRASRALRGRESFYYWQQSLQGSQLIALHRHAPAGPAGPEEYAMVILNFSGSADRSPAVKRFAALFESGTPGLE